MCSYISCVALGFSHLSTSFRRASLAFVASSDFLPTFRSMALVAHEPFAHFGFLLRCSSFTSVSLTHFLSEGFITNDVSSTLLSCFTQHGCNYFLFRGEAGKSAPSDAILPLAFALPLCEVPHCVSSGSKKDDVAVLINSTLVSWFDAVFV